MDEGPLTGSYARDIRVIVYDGKMHPVDSNEISFKLAARNAFKEAFRNAGPKIMEPIYDVEVLTPSDYMGAVMSDLQNRRAMIMGMESDKGFDRLNARVPLAELYRYSTTLSSLSSGAATYTMKFASYGSGGRAGQAAESLYRHRRGVNRRNFTKEGCLYVRQPFFMSLCTPKLPRIVFSKGNHMSQDVIIRRSPIRGSWPHL